MSNEDYGKYTIHPAAALFPLMTGKEFDELVADVKGNGLHHPIVTLDNSIILDGRNRYRACEAAGVVPHYAAYKGDKDEAAILNYIASANIHRRHLTTSQRTVIAGDLLPLYTAAAKERQEEGQNKGRKTRYETIGSGRQRPEPSKVDDSGRATTQAAKAMKVGKTGVKLVKAIKEKDPKLVEPIREGKATVKETARQAGILPKKKRSTAEVISEKGKFNYWHRRAIKGAAELSLFYGSLNDQERNEDRISEVKSMIKSLQKYIDGMERWIETGKSLLPHGKTMPPQGKLRVVK